MRSQQSFLSWFLWLLLRFFSLSLVFSNLIIMCLDVVFSVFILFGFHWTSKISRLIFLIKSGEVFSSIPETPITYMLEHLIVHSFRSFPHFSSQCFSLNTFYCPVFKFTDRVGRFWNGSQWSCLLLFTTLCNLLLCGLDLVTYFWWIFTKVSGCHFWD